MSIYNHIGNEIRRLRELRHVTQSDMAAALDVTANTVSRWETGTYQIGIAALQTVAAYFCVPLYALLPREDANPQMELFAAAYGLADDDMAALLTFAEYLQWRRTIGAEGRGT